MDALYEHKGIDINSPIVNAITSGGSVVIAGGTAEQRNATFLICEALGLMMSTSPSKRTSLVIAAEDASGSKLDRAKALNIPLCSFDEFRDAVAFVYSEETAADMFEAALNDKMIYAGPPTHGKES